MPELSDLNIILKALEFAARKHRDQRRKDAEATPYINHPIQVASVLAGNAGVTDPLILAAAILHDTLEDTETTESELERHFGAAITAVVCEVSDDKRLPKETRKLLQIEEAATRSKAARLVKLADKICNLRDMADAPPANWSLERRREYFDWAKAVIDRMRGSDATLEALFDQAYQHRP